MATAVVLYALVVALQVGTPPSSHIASVLVAIPAVVAFGWRPPVIIGSAVVAAGTRWAFLPTEPLRIGSAVGTTVVIAVIATLGCFAVHRRDMEYARLWKVASVAEAAQRAVLRPPPEELGCFRAAASYRAAAQYARIGGDLYAVADTDFGVRALIGDVRGKGLEAVSTAAAVLGSFHAAAYEQPTLGLLADRLDTGLNRFLQDDEAFVTALLVEIAPDGHVHAYSCGHLPVLILRDGVVRELPASPDLPLGLRGVGTRPGTAAKDPQPPGTRLRPGDTLLLYTDGLAETRDATGAFYPLAQRVTACLSSGSQPLDPHHLLTWLHLDAQDYGVDDAHDDAALLALSWPADSLRDGLRKVADEDSPVGGPAEDPEEPPGRRSS